MSRRRILLPATLIASVAFSLVMGQQVQAQPASSSSAARAAKPSPSDLGGPAWSSLTAAQRQALSPLERDWSSIDGSRKSKWLEIAARYPALPPDEQRRLQERMTEWARLTPAERGRARLSFQEAKQLSPQERQARWEAYQALPEDQRKALAERARPTAAERGYDKPRPAVASAPLAAVPKQTTAASAPPRPVVKPVAPTVVQAAPGATTTLMTKSPTPPPHQHPGQPKIVASPTHVDRSTLLPKGGPQAPIASQARAGGAASSPHP